MQPLGLYSYGSLPPVDELNAAIAAARAGGEILRAGFGRSHAVSAKGPRDIVTEVDRAAEERIIAILVDADPTYGFLCEERGTISAEGDARWIVDPLDGTTNYAASFPHFCVSIALERARQLQVGVVYDPLRDELYVAQRGEGAWLNGTPIHVSDTDSLARAVISTGFPSDESDAGGSGIEKVAPQVRGLRSTGSSALDLAAIACGRREAHWERGLKAFDMAAGVLLVREAGGIVTDGSGRDDCVDAGEIIAGNPAIYKLLFTLLSSLKARGL